LYMERKNLEKSEDWHVEGFIADKEEDEPRITRRVGKRLKSTSVEADSFRYLAVFRTFLYIIIVIVLPIAMVPMKILIFVQLCTVPFLFYLGSHIGNLLRDPVYKRKISIYEKGIGIPAVVSHSYNGKLERILLFVAIWRILVVLRVGRFTEKIEVSLQGRYGRHMQRSDQKQGKEILGLLKDAMGERFDSVLEKKLRLNKPDSYSDEEKIELIMELNRYLDKAFETGGSGIEEPADGTGESTREPPTREPSHETTTETVKPLAAALDEQRGEYSIEQLIEHLENEDAENRWKAAELLGETGNEKAVEPLIAALQDDDPEVRGCAAAALGTMGNAAALPHLERLTNDQEWFVEFAETVGEVALDAMNKIRDNNRVNDNENVEKNDDSATNSTELVE